MTLSITKIPTGNPFDCHGLKYGYCEWGTIGMKCGQTLRDVLIIKVQDWQHFSLEVLLMKCMPALLVPFSHN
jgi:hypothetical protein